MLLVTGGAGFIGVNFVRSSLQAAGEPVLSLDKLTYAGNLRSLEDLRNDRRHVLVQGDLANQEWVQQATSGEYRRQQQANYIARGGSYADYLPPDIYADHVPRGGS